MREDINANLDGPEVSIKDPEFVLLGKCFCGRAPCVAMLFTDAFTGKPFVEFSCKGCFDAKVKAFAEMDKMVRDIKAGKKKPGRAKINRDGSVTLASVRIPVVHSGMKVVK